MAGPGDPSATFIAGNTAPGETTSTRCKSNGFVEVIFSLGGAVVSRVESGTACTPGNTTGGTGGSSTSTSQTGRSLADTQAEQDAEDSNYQISQGRGGADTPSASEWENQQEEYGVGEETSGGGDDEDGDDEDKEPEFETVATPIEPSLRPVTEQEQEAVEAFVAKVNKLLAAEEAFKAAEQAVEDAEALLLKVENAAAEDMKNDLYNFGLSQLTGYLTDKATAGYVGDNPPDNLDTELKEAVIGALGDKISGLAEAETPEEMATILANRAGEGTADAIMEGVGQALDAIGKINPGLEVIASLGVMSMDVAKMAAKGAVSLEQIELLRANVRDARANLAQNHAGAVGGALRALYSQEGAEVLEQSYLRSQSYNSYHENNDTRTSGDIARYEEATALYAQAEAAAQQLVDVAKEHVAAAGETALYDGVKDNLRQTMRRRGGGESGARGIYTTAYEAYGLQGTDYTDRLQIALQDAVSDFGHPDSAQFDAMSIKNYTYETVQVDPQVRERPDVAAPSNVAFIGNMRVYANLGLDTTRDRRGATVSNTDVVSVSAGFDIRLVETVVAGVSIQVSGSQEDDDAGFIELDTTRVSLTPYATYELSSDIYFDAYATYGLGWQEAEARDGTGESADGMTRQWGFGIGANTRHQLDEQTKLDMRLGGSVARSTSDSLVFASRTARGKAGKTSGTVAGKVKLTHENGPWTFTPSAELSYQTGSISRTSTRWRARPQVGISYDLESVPGFSVGVQAYHDLLQPDLRSMGGSLNASYSF